MTPQHAPLTGIYALADEYLESILYNATEISRKPDSPPSAQELTNILLHLARLNQYEGQLENSQLHGKSFALARLIGTDFLDIHLSQDDDETIHIRVFDAVHRKDIIKAVFPKNKEYNIFILQNLTFY